MTPPPRERGGFSLGIEVPQDGQALTAAEAGVQRTTPLRGSGNQDAFPSPAEAGGYPSNKAYMDRAQAHSRPCPDERVLAVFDWLHQWFGEPGFRGCATRR